MTLERLTQITSVGITSGISLNSATLTGVTTISSLSIDSINTAGIITAQSGLNVTGGSVGIGTDNPDNTLSIRSSGAYGISLQQDLGNQLLSSRIFLGSSSGSTTIFNNTGSIVFHTGAIIGNTSGNEKLRITSGGDVNVAAGGSVFIANGNLVFSTSGSGIDFSATADGSGTTTSELLDDYEEGTWTPTIDLSVSSPTYSKQEGNYTKIGNVVTVSCTLAISNGTTDGSTFRVGGFPFTAITLTDRAFIGIVKANSVSSNGEKLIIYMNSNATTAFLNVQSSTGTGGFTGNQFGTTGSISFSITYIAA